MFPAWIKRPISPRGADKALLTDRYPDRLAVLDLARSVALSTPSVTDLCEAWGIYFCWAPDRPALLVRKDEQHLVYELDGPQLWARPVHPEQACGKTPSWVITPEVSRA